MYIPFLTPTIPSATPGAFQSVGYAMVHARAGVRHTVEYPKLAGRSIMDLNRVGFAVYYPASGSSSKTVQWCPEPAEDVVDGYEAYFDLYGVSWLFFLMKKIVRRFRIPLVPNAPVAPVRNQSKYPLLIFSHGLAGTRTTYSQYCQALASEGYVVLAIEHHDGSGPMYVTPDDDGNMNVYPYAAFKNLEWKTGEPVPDPMRLRGLQLDFRVREVYETYAAFKRMLSGEGDVLVEGMRVEQERTFLSQLRDAVNVEELNVGGHSMGGGTTFRLLQVAPPEGYSPMPIRHAISLDPWLLPFKFADERPPTRQPIPPSLAINSQEYTEWEDHFPQVVSASQKIGGKLVTVTGMSHECFSDSPIIASLSLPRARKVLMACHKLTMSLFTDGMDSSKFIKGLMQDGGDVAKTASGKLTTKHGEVVVHLA